MTVEQEREIRLSIEVSELHQVLEALSTTNRTTLAVRVKAAKIQRDTQFAAGLQAIRDRLFRLKGFLGQSGYPREALTWVNEAIEVETSLRNELWGE